MIENESIKLINIALRDKVTHLNLSQKQLKTLPTEIQQLTSLKSLDLSKNGLSSLSVEIGQFTNLSILNLYFNHLTALPREISQLIKLSILNLCGNYLTSLPTEIVQLSNLMELNLSYNRLVSLSAEIGQITSLRTLNLSNNQLTSLPAEIGELSNLRTLNLSNNQLTSLPAEIGKLSNLTELNLSNNQITSLPAKIGQITRLKTLSLYSNQLTSLPEEISKLSNLTELDLSDNQMPSIPPEIVQLPSLIELDLSDNQITSLPSDIVQLENLEFLILNGNPIKTPPIEIAENGIDSVKAYFRQLIADEKDYIYEAKLLIVGEAGAGKTTLAKKIEDQEYQLKDENSTKGIDIIQWKFPIGNGRDFRVNIWDFGGQEIYHTTHQFFLTERSLYALVADTRKEDTDFYYWCNIVTLLSGNSPMLIVKNEKQDRRREINERQLRGQFTNFKETLATNLATNRGLTKILYKIKHYIEELPHIGNALPKTWIKVREILEENRHRNYISLEEYLRICENNGFKRKDDKLQLSRYLHDLGVCLHFQEDAVLKKTLIINPEWGTSAVYKVLDNHGVISNLGEFTKFDLKKIWCEDKYADMQDELLQLMIKFKLCYEIPDNSGNFIAPQLLTENQPDYDWDEANNLHLRYRYLFMPKGIVTRFIVAMHRWIYKQRYVWKSGVILFKDNSKVEVIEDYNSREIKVRVSGSNMKELISIVAYELDKINNSYHRLKYDKLIPCNCGKCKISRTPYFYEYSDLTRRIEKGRQEVECGFSYEMLNVRSLIDDLGSVEMLTSKPEGKIRKSHIRSDNLTRNNIFISYSHKDKDMLERVQTHLKVLEYERISVIIWDDSHIKPGMKWSEEIKKALSVCKIAILLISTDFLASDYVRTNELPNLLKAAENDGATILPLILKPCRFNLDKKLSAFQAVNDPNIPLSRMNEAEQDEVLVKLTERVTELIKD